MPDQYFPGDLLLYKKLFGEQAIPSITYTNLKAPAFSNAALAGFNNRKISPLFYSGESQPLPDIDYEQWGLDMFLNSNQDKINRKLALKNSLASNVGNITGAVGAGLQITADAVNEGKGTFDLDAWNKSQNRIASGYNQYIGNANTTSDLLNVYDNMPDYVSKANDIETKKYNVGKSLGAAASGAAAGSLFGPIGTVVGAGAGFLANSIGQWVGIGKDKRNKNTAIDDAEDLAELNSLAITNGQRRVSNNIYRQGMANYLNNAAFGGPLFTHGADFTDDLIRIDAGGTHEQNPYGGVPAGVDPNGIPNLVEEGEIIWDDYVFSDRLKMPKSLMKKYKLGGRKDKAISFAEGVDKITEKLGTKLRPNDPITQNTKDEILSEFEEVQEEKRIKQQKKNLIKAMSEMTPEEFQAMMMPQQAPAEAPMAQEQMPPQGMEMQAPQEPVGLMAPGMAAYGGHILDGTKGESRRITKELAGPYRLPGVGVIGYRDLYDKEVEMHKDEKGNWWVDGRMVGKDEGAAQRYARQIANTRATLNMSGDLGGESTVSTARKELKRPTGKAETKSKATLPERQQDPLATPYLNADLTGITVGPQQFIPDRLGTVNPDEYYDAWGVGRFLPGDYASYYGRIHSPYAKTPGWSVLAKDASPEDAVQEAIQESTPPTPKPKPKGTGTGAGTAKGAASTQTPAEWTPNKIFSISGVNPIDQWRSQSVMFNPPATRSAVEKAVEGVREGDPETTVSVGAQDTKNLPTWMRYAPLIGGGISLLSDIFNRPDYSAYEDLIAETDRTSSPVNIPVETIGARIRRNPFDERLAVNQANQNLASGLRSTMDTAGGNRAYRQYASNLLAYNNQGQLADIARNAYLANRQDALQTADFNRQTDLYNMNAINQRNLTQGQLNASKQYQGLMAKARLVDALENAKRYDDQLVSADFSTLMQNLHNLGNENFAFNQQAALAREGLDRLKYLGKSGNMVFNPEDGTWTVVAKCGGKVKTKKRRF